MQGFITLLYKESLRFWKVGFQTLAAPIITSLLYLLVFGHTLRNHAEIYPGVSYIAFLVPGLVMMSILQNAFANTSSSLIQSKITGNIVFILLPPFAPWEIFWAYVLAAILRGVCVGLGVFCATVWLVPLTFAAPWYLLAFLFLGATTLGTLGFIAGIYSEKFEQLAAFQNFLIMPMTFLSGVFYSAHTLPPLWHTILSINPFFYLVDGFRYGFFGVSDFDPLKSLAISLAFCLSLILLALRLLAKGYKLRN
jgi:ABC-2 type transport system permease protein